MTAVSHDRFFLDRIRTHRCAFEGDAYVEWFEGNFEDADADKIRRLGPDPVSSIVKRNTEGG